MTKKSSSTKINKPKSRIDRWVSKVSERVKKSQTLMNKGKDHEALIAYDIAFDDVPEDIIEKVHDKIEEMYSKPKKLK